jgi:uncharacterized membrane protein YheB (UPF0754 family)
MLAVAGSADLAYARHHLAPHRVISRRVRVTTARRRVIRPSAKTNGTVGAVSGTGGGERPGWTESGWCDPREHAGHTPAWRLTLGTALGVAAMVNIARAQPAFAGTPSTSTISQQPRATDRGAGASGSVAHNRAIAELSAKPTPAKASGKKGKGKADPAPTTQSWVQLKTAEAAVKFRSQWALYCAIPIVAGVVNWITNALAVKMIFSPEEYIGLNIKRWPDTPAGLIGWQGIVPCKVEKMSTTMVDLMTKRLLDVREVFGRLDKAKCGELLTPGIDSIAGGVVNDVAKTKGGALEWVGTSGVLGAVPDPVVNWGRNLAREQGKELVAEVLGEMQERVPEVWDVKTQVVGAMCRDKKIIIELFQRCGKEEFVFIRRSGLYFGFLFGIIQMAQWLVWDPWWSLAVGGALVGYATDWLALKLMFEPVEPVKLPFGFVLHGAFIRRQQEVSGEFAQLLRERILTAELIWREILTADTTKKVFKEILERKTREQVGKARAANRLICAASIAMGPKAWARCEDAVVARVAADLPSHLPSVYGYSDEALDLEETLKQKMQQLSGQEFEGVLHPVFQEDELTLILVGAFLGMVAGFAQAAFF